MGRTIPNAVYVLSLPCPRHPASWHGLPHVLLGDVLYANHKKAVEIARLSANQQNPYTLNGFTTLATFAAIQPLA